MWEKIEDENAKINETKQNVFNIKSKLKHKNIQNATIASFIMWVIVMYITFVY